MATQTTPKTSAQSVAPEPRGGPIVERRVTEELAAFCATLSADDIPRDVVKAAKYFAFDFAGVALRGSLEDSSRVVFETAARLSPPDADGATVVGRADRTRPHYAALANGASAHALELDDTHQEGSIHPGVTVIPAALAMAEAVDAAGRDLLAAVAVGYEVACRLAMALRPAEHYAHGFHPTATCGVFAAAAAAGRLLHLSADQMANAFGIAGSQAAGSLEFLADGAWTKRFHPGWAAHSGIIAAELARSGFLGPRRILEGKAGFLRSYSDSPRVEAVLADLGSAYQIVRTAIKPHACCRYNQAPIDGVLKLVAEEDVDPAAIDRITIGLLDVGFPIVAEPLAQKRRPRSVVDAQFSIHFAAAIAAARRRAGLAEYRLGSLSAPEVLALMDRVECVPAPELDALFPKRWPATVEITLRDGRRLQTRVDYPKGDPENPLTWDELAEKFDSLVSDLLTAERRAEILAAARNLDGRSARSFSRLLAAEGTPGDRS
ncbi:MAG: MmgE/PrpD family protein [Chloroflexi bacterium]|nr:MmgE/PrpD family protein [Chloroflexota bacterium]